jgi:hypothetical protein
MGDELRLVIKPFELAAQQRLRRLAIQEDRKLEARGARIQDKDGIAHTWYLAWNL